MNRCLAWLAYSLSALAVLVSLATGRLPFTWVANSDTLFYSALLRDIARNRGLAGWDFPTNPYLFPDLPLYLPFRYAFADTSLSLLAYALVQVALFTAGIILLTRHLFPRPPRVESLVLLAGSVYWLLLGTGQYHPLVYPLLMLHHFGVVVLVPVCILLVSATLDERTTIRRRGVYLIVLSVLSFLVALSDLLFSVQYVIPTACALLLIWRVRPGLAARTKLLAGTLLVSAVLGEVVRQAIVDATRTVHHTKLDSGHVRNTLLQFQQSLVGISLNDAVLLALWCVSFAAILIPFVGSLKRRDEDGADNTVGLLLFDATIVVSLLLSTAAIAVSGNYYGPATVRYLLPAFVLPLFLGLPYWAGRTRTGRRLLAHRFAPVLSGAVALSALFGSTWPVAIATSTPWLRLTDPVIACLDMKAQQRDLHRGVAQYWVASYATELSKIGLVVAQVNRDLSPVHLNNSLLWYEADFDFAVVDSMPDWGIAARQVIERFGSPADTFDCGPYTVLVYNRPDDVVFRNYFASHSLLADFRLRHDAYEFRGIGLPSSTGRMVGYSRGADQQHGDRDGALTFGPYAQLPPGDYRYAIHYFSDGPNVGEWQIGVRNSENAERILERGEFASSGMGVISGTMALTEPQVWEARTYFYGHGALYVDKIVLEKDRPRSSPHGAGHRNLPRTPVAEAEASSITLVEPRHGETLSTQYVDFVWQWPGTRLGEGQTFEVRLWRADDPFHYGAHDARLASNMVRQVDDVYSIRLNLRGVYSVQQHGPGEYQWSVGVVAIDPSYQDLGVEALPRSITVEPAVLGYR